MKTYLNAIETSPFISEAHTLETAAHYKRIYGCNIRIRGRHSNRKAALGRKWAAGRQNDIPWRMAERVAYYKRN